MNAYNLQYLRFNAYTVTVCRQFVTSEFLCCMAVERYAEHKHLPLKGFYQKSVISIVSAPETIISAPVLIGFAPETIISAPVSIVFAPETIVSAAVLIVLAAEMIVSAPVLIGSAPETIVSGPGLIGFAPEITISAPVSIV